MNRYGTVTQANAEYTGGNIYRYTAKTSLGLYMIGDSEWDCIYLVDSDPNATEDSWYSEWMDEHQVGDELENDEYYKALREMLTWIIENEPDGNYAVNEIEDNLADEMKAWKGEEEDGTTDRLVSKEEFLEIYNAALTLMFNDIDNSLIYGKDVTIHWNGIYCNCGDGATAYNHIIQGIQDVIDEE